MSNFVRGHSNPDATDQHRPYGVNPEELPGGMGRDYDHQVKSGDQTRSTSSLRASSAMAERSSGVIESVTDPRYMSPKSVHEVQMDDIVRIKGIGDMTMRSAVEAGFVAYPTAPGAIPQAVEAKADNDAGDETHPDLQVEQMDPETESVLGEFTQGADSGSLIAAAQEIAEGNQEFSDDIVEAVASQLKIEPDVAREKAATVRQGFEKQALDAAKDVAGDLFDAEDFVAFAWSEGQKSAMGEAILQQTMRGSTAGYREVAQAFAESYDTINPDAILNADFGEGVGARQGSDGRIVITKDGNPFVDWATAVRQGIIKVSRK